MSNAFSAAEPALGYLYQVRYALALLLEAPYEAVMSIERFDDIAFESGSVPQELLQTKHHTNPASLTDASADLWKTIRIWAEGIRDKTLTVPGVQLTLITTSTASEGSVGFWLRPGGARKPEEAYDRLLQVATTSTNRSNAEGYRAFLSLSEDVRKDLVRSVLVLDRSPGIEDVVGRIKARLRFATRPERLDALYSRVEGWWFARAIQHLAGHSADRITVHELQAVVNEVAEQLRPDSLPIDFQDLEPPDDDVDSDRRLFVQQLRLIGLGNPRIRHARRDFIRAFTQRSQWIREELLQIGEVSRYEDRLVDEWDRYYQIVKESLEGLSDSVSPPTEVNLQQGGRAVYNWMEQTAKIQIRRDCTEPYVMRGSYHMLANVNPPRVWWHPLFPERVNANGATPTQEAS